MESVTNGSYIFLLFPVFPLRILQLISFEGTSGSGEFKKRFLLENKMLFLRRQSRRAGFVYCSHSRRFCAEQFSIPRDNLLLSCRHKSRRERKNSRRQWKMDSFILFFLAESRIEFYCSASSLSNNRNGSSSRQKCLR